MLNVEKPNLVNDLNDLQQLNQKPKSNRRSVRLNKPKTVLKKLSYGKGNVYQ